MKKNSKKKLSSKVQITQ